MENKFCFSKTTAYLIALVVAVVGTFFATNYINSQRLNYNSKAATGSGCKQNGESGIFVSVQGSPLGCDAPELKKRYGTSFYHYKPGDFSSSLNGKASLYCCIPNIKNSGTAGGGVGPTKKLTPTPELTKCTDKRMKGLWYKTSSYKSCSDLGSGYFSGTNYGVTEKKSGYICCVQQKKAATPTPLPTSTIFFPTPKP